MLAQFTQQAAMNAYRQFLARNQAQRQIEDYTRQAFGPTATGGLGEVPRLTSSYARRGLYGQGIRSGAYDRALNEYARRRAQTMGRAQEDLASSMRGFELAESGYRSDYERGLADLEREKARQISQDAQALLNLR
jgi:hypothetical protein